MVNLLPIGKAIWNFSKPAVAIAGQVMIGLATVTLASKAVDGISARISSLRDTKQAVVRKAKKHSNSKKASGNRKGTAKKTTKSKANGEKSTVLNNQ